MKGPGIEHGIDQGIEQGQLFAACTEIMLAPSWRLFGGLLGAARWVLRSWRIACGRAGVCGDGGFRGAVAAGLAVCERIVAVAAGVRGRRAVHAS
jgi:hypothetical protein